MVSHHLTDETLQDYVAGALSAPMETLIACHLTVCPMCRKKVEMAERIGGAILAEQQSVGVSKSAADIIAMAESSAQPAHGGYATSSTLPNAGSAAASAGTNGFTPIPGVPRPLARLLPSTLDELPWKSFGPGMKQYTIDKQPRKEGAFKLLSLDPGSRMSKHSHNHRELTFILSGSYSDEMGQFKAGDIADLSADHHHTPHVDSDVPCISLIATDAPVKFDSLFGKIVQPFVGI